MAFPFNKVFIIYVLVSPFPIKLSSQIKKKKLEKRCHISKFCSFNADEGKTTNQNKWLINWLGKYNNLTNFHISKVEYIYYFPLTGVIVWFCNFKIVLKLER